MNHPGVGPGPFVFSFVDDLQGPHSWKVDEFCALVFSDLKKNPDTSGDVELVEIRHYKELNGLQHEFLLVQVRHASRYRLLRVERSTLPRPRRTFWQKMTQTSSSITLALDMVNISSSFEKLTSGMKRGPIIHVATLPIPSTSITVYDFCLLLFLFPSFSPMYKLKEEQCYWFCNVVMAAISTTGDMTLVRGAGFEQAGKFGRLSVKISPLTRQTFIDSYKIVRRLQVRPTDTLSDIDFTPDAAKTLVALLSVPSDEAKTQAIVALTLLASHSQDYQRMLVDAGSANQFSRIFITAPVDLKASILSSLDTLNLYNRFEQLLDLQILTIVQKISTDDTFAAEDKIGIEMGCASAIQDLMKLSQDERPAISVMSTKIISRFLKHGKFSLVSESYDYSNQIIMIKFLKKAASECRDLHLAIADALPHIVAPLRFSRHVYEVAVDLFSSLLTYSDLRPHAQAVIVQMFGPLEDSDHAAKMYAIEFVAKVACSPSLHYAILDAFPRIVDILRDSIWRAREAAVGLLAEFIVYSDLRPRVQAVVPEIFSLFNDDSYEVRQSVLGFIEKAAPDVNFRSAIIGVFPQIIGLVEDKSEYTRQKAINVLSNLSTNSDLRPHVQVAISRILHLLNNDYYWVRLCVVRFIKQAISDSALRPAIVGAFPLVVHALATGIGDIHQDLVDLLYESITYPDLHPHIRAVVPEVRKLLEYYRENVRESARKFMDRAVAFGLC